MGNLEVISVNLWDILISLCNLLLITLILKKFLYQPVKKVLAQRQATLQQQYDAAKQAQEQAEHDRDAYTEKLRTANDEAERVMKEATAAADHRSEAIVASAHERADSIVRQAQTQAELELKKAEDSMKTQIVDVSTELTEKLLSREINADDHRKLIDSFIDGIGESDGTEQ